MAKFIKPADAADVLNIRRAHELLREARDLLTGAGAARAAAATRTAVASAGGALRHAEHRRDRTAAAMTEER